MRSPLLPHTPDSRRRRCNARACCTGGIRQSMDVVSSLTATANPAKCSANTSQEHVHATLSVFLHQQYQSLLVWCFSHDPFRTTRVVYALKRASQENRPLPSSSRKFYAPSSLSVSPGPLLPPPSWVSSCVFSSIMGATCSRSLVGQRRTCEGERRGCRERPSGRCLSALHAGLARPARNVLSDACV